MIMQKTAWWGRDIYQQQGKNANDKIRLYSLFCDRFSIGMKVVLPSDGCVNLCCFRLLQRCPAMLKECAKRQSVFVAFVYL